MNKPINYRRPAIFNVGDTVKCLRQIDFVDMTKHLIGVYYEVKEDTLDYYNCNQDDYLLVERRD